MQAMAAELELLVGHFSCAWRGEEIGCGCGAGAVAGSGAERVGCSLLLLGMVRGVKCGGDGLVVETGGVGDGRW